MNARQFNGDDERNLSPTPLPAAEELFQEATWHGLIAVSAVNHGDAEYAGAEAREAASLYHEGQREAGECPECGSRPYRGHYYNSSIGCCKEPPEPDGEAFRGGEAAGYAAECQAAAQRLK